MSRRPPKSTLFPNTPLFRSRRPRGPCHAADGVDRRSAPGGGARRGRTGSEQARNQVPGFDVADARSASAQLARSEEHTSELQSRQYLVCRLLLEKNTALTSF